MRNEIYGRSGARDEDYEEVNRSINYSIYERNSEMTKHFFFSEN